MSSSGPPRQNLSSFSVKEHTNVMEIVNFSLILIQRPARRAATRIGPSRKMTTCSHARPPTRDPLAKVVDFDTDPQAAAKGVINCCIECLHLARDCACCGRDAVAKAAKVDADGVKECCVIGVDNCCGTKN